MSKSTRFVLFGLVGLALVFYLTLGLGLMTGGGAASDPDYYIDNPDELPNWADLMDSVTAPLRPRVDFGQESWEFRGSRDDPLVIDVPRSSSDWVRRATFRVESPGLSLTYSCSGCGEPQAWSSGETDRDEVSFKIEPVGGRIEVRPTGTDRATHRLILE